MDNSVFLYATKNILFFVEILYLFSTSDKKQLQMYKKKILHLETYLIRKKIFTLTVILRMSWGRQSVLSSDWQMSVKLCVPVYRSSRDSPEGSRHGDRHRQECINRNLMKFNFIIARCKQLQSCAAGKTKALAPHPNWD